MRRPLSRRRFLGATGAAAAAAALGGPALLAPACAKGDDYDLVVTGGLLYDGLGAPPVPADVAIAGGLIRAVGRLSYSRRTTVLNARGLSVAPMIIPISPCWPTPRPRAPSARA